MNPDPGAPLEGTLRFGHSPDPDDAYMFYGFAAGGIEVEVKAGLSGAARRYRVEHLLEDIQSLNERALRAELEITAISAHAYPYVAATYRVMRTGVSMGDGYGPIVVAREPRPLDSLRGARIAVPGLMTTAYLALQLRLRPFTPEVVPFDAILEQVREGKAEAGLIIHEGQLTFATEGLVKVADLGEDWKAETGLPLPLGVDAVRRDLGPELAVAASRALRASIEYADAHRSDALAYALRYGRGLDDTLGDRFIGMYVNAWTRDMGEPGRQALQLLFERGAAAGLIPAVPEIDLA